MSQKKFKYVANDKTGQRVVGDYKAENRDQVADYLRERDLFIVSITQDLGLDFKSLSDIQIGGASLKDRMVLVKQMSTMMQAGLPVLQCLDILAKQLDSKQLQEQLESVQREIEGGSTLSSAFQKHAKLFNEVQINLISAGEKSGNLVEVIGQVAFDMEKSHALQSKLRSAMIYPAIIFFAIAIVMIILVVFMVPTVKSLYADFNALDKIPDITKFLISVSEFFQNPLGLGAIIFVLIIAFFLFRSFQSTEQGKMAIAGYSLKLPVFGQLIQKAQLAQFGRILSMLMKSGVPIIEALKIVSKSLSNPLYTKAIMQCAEEVSKGVPLAVPLANSAVFPLIYIRLVSTGEQTGNLDKVLADLGKYYDAEVDEITNNLTKLMEPIILLVVGGMVGFLAVAVYLPIYSIGNVIS